MANIAMRYLDKLRKSNALSLPKLGDVTIINHIQPSSTRVSDPLKAAPLDFAMLTKRLLMAFARFDSTPINTRQVNKPNTNAQPNQSLRALPKNTATGLINAVVRGLVVQLQALNVDEPKTSQHSSEQPLQPSSHGLNVDKLLAGQDLSIEALRATIKVLGPMIKAFNTKQQSDTPVLVQDIAKQYSTQLQLSKDESQRALCHSALDLLSQSAATVHAQLNVLTHMDSTLTELTEHIKTQDEKQQKQSQQSRALKGSRSSSETGSKEEKSDTPKDKPSLFNIDKKELFKVALGTIGLDDLPDIVNFDALFAGKKGEPQATDATSQPQPDHSPASVAQRASQTAVKLAPTDTGVTHSHSSSAVISAKTAIIHLGAEQSTSHQSALTQPSQNKNTQTSNSVIQSRSLVPVSTAATDKAAPPPEDKTRELLNAAVRSLGTQLQAVAKASGQKSPALTSENMRALCKGQSLDTHALRQLLTDFTPLVGSFNQQQKSAKPITQSRMLASYKEMQADAPKPQHALLQTLIKQTTVPRTRGQKNPRPVAKLDILSTLQDVFAQQQTHKVKANKPTSKSQHEPQTNREASSNSAKRQSIFKIDKQEWLKVALGTLGLDDLPNILDLNALFSSGNPKASKQDKLATKPQSKSLAKRVTDSVTGVTATRRPSGNKTKSAKGRKAAASSFGRVGATALLGGIGVNDIATSTSVSTEHVATPKTMHLNNAHITMGQGSKLIIQGANDTSAANKNTGQTKQHTEIGDRTHAQSKQQKAKQARTPRKGRLTHQKRARRAKPLARNVKANRTNKATSPAQTLVKLATEYLSPHVTPATQPSHRSAGKQPTPLGRMISVFSPGNNTPTHKGSARPLSNKRRPLANPTRVPKKTAVVAKVANLLGSSLTRGVTGNSASQMGQPTTRAQGQRGNVASRILNLGMSLFAQQKESLSDLNQTLRLFQAMLPKGSSADSLLNNLLGEQSSKRERRTNRRRPRNRSNNKPRTRTVNRVGAGRTLFSTLARGVSSAVSGVVSLAAGGMSALSGSDDVANKKTNKGAAKSHLGRQAQGNNRPIKALSNTGKSIASRLPSLKGLGRAVLGGARFVPIAGQALTAGLAVLDGAAGWQRAGENFALQANEKASTGQKVASAAGSILSGISFGQLDEGNTARTLYDVGSKVANFGSNLFSGFFPDDNPQSAAKSSVSQRGSLLKTAALPLTMMAQPHALAATTNSSAQVSAKQHIPTHTSRVHTAAMHEPSKEKNQQTEGTNIASSLQIDTKTSIAEPLNDQTLRKDTLTHVINTQAAAKKMTASASAKPVSASRKPMRLNRPASSSTPAQSSFGVDDYGIAIMNSILFD